MPHDHMNLLVQIIQNTADTDIQPLDLVLDNLGKLLTILKSPKTNGTDMCRQMHLLQCPAIVESIVADGLQGIRKVQIQQFPALTEAMMVDHLQCVRKLNILHRFL